MHSNSYLGIGPAAMVHIAAATPNLTFDVDTHYSWVSDDVVKGGKLQFKAGAIDVPRGPGLGVQLDRAAVERLHALYDSAGIKDRDDTDEITKYIPGIVRQVPKW